jgi:hypothetical protein
MSKVESVYGGDRSWQRLPSLVQVADYEGQTTVAIAATQLGTKYTRTQASRVVDEWVEFFASGPTPITELHFRTRTPKRLFEALAPQVQLQALFVKWGDYDDLTPLQDMRSLSVLHVAGASRVTDVRPLAQLTSLRRLGLESLLKVRDVSPLGALTALTHLDLGGDWMSPRNARIESLAWLVELRNLQHLLLHTLAVDDLDYTPLLRLERLQAVRVMRVRGMKPAFDLLKEQLPWAE